MTYPSTLYPNAKDTVSYIQVVNGVTSINDALFYKISTAILAIENELGIKPAGTYSDVRQRLDAMEVGFDSAVTNTLSPHSTTIATKFNMNWISPTIAIPGPSTMVLPTTVGQLSFNLLSEAGFLDGYGYLYFANRFFVDSDCSLQLSLWDVTAAPLQLLTNTFTFGFHNYAAIIPVSIENLNVTYEVRAKQTSIVSYPTNTDSIILNSRLMFFPTVLGTGGPGGGMVDDPPKYITVDITFADFPDTPILVGELPAGAMVQNTVVTVITPFDSGTIDIGTLLTYDLLVDATDFDMTIPDVYSKDNNEYFSAITPALATLTGTPTQGSAKIIIYYH